MKRKRKSYKNNYYNITINNNYYNNVEKDPQETEDTNNKEIDNNNQNKEISKSDTSYKNNPTTFCKNMMPLILFLCISFNIFILFTPLFIKHGITKVNSNPRIPFVTQDSLFVNENPVL